MVLAKLHKWCVEQSAQVDVDELEVDADAEWSLRVCAERTKVCLPIISFIYLFISFGRRHDCLVCIFHCCTECARSGHNVVCWAVIEFSPCNDHFR